MTKQAPMHRVRVLVVEDDPVSSLVIQELLKNEDCICDSCDNISGAKEKLSSQTFDLVLLDLHLGHEDGLQLLPFLASEYPYTKAVVVTAHGSIDVAVKAVQAGATGFITKPVSKEKIKEAILPVKQTILNAQTPLHGPWEAMGMIGVSAAVRTVQSNILRMKDVDSTVLITGESGTGKELVARALHKFSPRSHERFEAINCGAIPENLIESELFGHRKGAFTDAKADRKGLFETCKDGVVFLDEVGELPLMMQVKLLRVLQEREITPVGASAPIKVNPRVIAATNKDLSQEVRLGRFREDLYFRLAVLCIGVPNLSQRVDDIPHLVQFFVNKFNERFVKNIQAPSRELLLKLQKHHWPGNIRELQNAVERGVVLSQDGELHFDEMVQVNLSFASAASKEPKEDGAYTSNFDPEVFANRLDILPLTDAKEKFESTYLQRLLAVAGGNISEAARISGRYRADLYRLFSKYGIDPAKYKASEFFASNRADILSAENKDVSP